MSNNPGRKAKIARFHDWLKDHPVLNAILALPLALFFFLALMVFGFLALASFVPFMLPTRWLGPWGVLVMPIVMILFVVAIAIVGERWRRALGVAFVILYLACGILMTLLYPPHLW